MTKVLLVLLLILGGATEDAPPFPRGVVLVNPDGSPNTVLPGRL